MVSQKLLIESVNGMHLRPAGVLSETAMKYEANISFIYGEGKTANAKSMISILAACVKCGQEIEIVCDGLDENEALQEVISKLQESLKD